MDNLNFQQQEKKNTNYLYQQNHLKHKSRPINFRLDGHPSVDYTKVFFHYVDTSGYSGKNVNGFLLTSSTDKTNPKKRAKIIMIRRRGCKNA